MFEHPYFTQQVTQYDQEQMERAAARRLFLIEHADQIVPRPAGSMGRMLRRIFRGKTATAGRGSRTARSAAGCETATAR